MINKMQDEIINNIYNLEEVKRFKELKNSLNKNEEYKELMNSFLKEKDNGKQIEIKKKLFLIPEYKEYVKIDTDLRLLFNKINKCIMSTVSTHSCIK